MELNRAIETLDAVIPAPDNKMVDSGDMVTAQVIFDCLCGLDDCPTVAPKEQGQWISVNDRMPKAEERVLVCVENKYAGKTYKNVVTGMHEDGTVYREDSDWMFNDFDELRTYDEEKDDWIIPEGWWEYTLYNDENENYIIDGNVTHWMPIPEPPKEGPHEP